MQTGNKFGADVGTKVHRLHHEPHPDSGFLSRRQTAERYGLSISFLAALPRDVLWFHRVGRKTYYEPRHVEAYIRGQTTVVAAHLAPSAKGRGRPRKPALNERTKRDDLSQTRAEG